MGGGGGIQETADQVQQQKNNAELWNYYQTSYKPFIDKYVAKTTDKTTAGAQSARAAGQANAEAMKAASVVAPTGNPINTTKQMSAVADMETKATVDATGKVRQRQMGSLQNLVDIGRGQQTTAQQAQDAITQESVRKAAQDEQTSLQTQGAIENAAGSAVGTAAAIGSRHMNYGGPTEGLTFTPGAGGGGYTYDIPEDVGPSRQYMMPSP